MVLDNRVVQGHLAVTGHDHPLAIPDRQDGGSVKFIFKIIHVIKTHSLFARVGIVIHRHQPIDAQMGVFLGGGQAFVAQKFLNRTQIRPRIEHVGREAVTDAMGRNGNRKAYPAHQSFQNAPNRARCQPPFILI